MARFRRALGGAHGCLAAAVVTVALGAVGILAPAHRDGLVRPALAETESERHRKEHERPKGGDQRHDGALKHEAAPKHDLAPRKAPGSAGETLHKAPFSANEPHGPLPPEKRGAKTSHPEPGLKADLKKDGGKHLPPEPGPGQQHGVAKDGPVKIVPLSPPHAPGTGVVLKRFDDVKKLRVEHVEDGGKRKVIEEPGKRFIVKEHGQTIVRHDESELLMRRPGARSESRPDGTVETAYVRGDGVRIVSVVDAHGRLLRRYRRGPDGSEHDLIDNRRFYGRLAVGAGLGALAIAAIELPAPRVTIPADKYIVPYADASDDDLYEALDAPPIEDLDRAYSLAEIRDSFELRARVRSIDIDTIQFDSGAWEVSSGEYGKLARIARAMLRVLERNPDAVFLIAGFTDAVGSEDDNASLSDRRAAAVAAVLTEQFDVPAENLVTQGYGEQFLKVSTQGPEPRNRRVSVLNITRLMAER